MAEGFSEDAPSIPDAGLDEDRTHPFGWGDVPPAADGPANKFPFGLPTSLSGEQGTGAISPDFGENDFPRETGHDSLDDDPIPMT